MTYCTTADIIDRCDDDILIQLTDDEDIGSIVTEVIDDAVSDSFGEINGYIGRRYSLPLPSVPENLRMYNSDMAMYRLYCRRQGPPEWIQKLYNEAIAYLKLVSTGKADLDIEISDSVEDQSMEISVDNPPRFFTRTTMAYF